jgi:D-alanine-D-alanine ligase
MRNNKIAVLYGGKSNEREVCIKTGNAVYNTLVKNGYNKVYLIDVDKDICIKLNELRPDICFIALHGTYGEDGKIQGLLEMLEIPYTGSGVAANAIAFDKDITKKLFKLYEINTPEYCLADNIENVKYPCIVKPAREGSTIGISIVENESELKPAIDEARKFDDKVIIEDFIQGKEITVSILNGEVLPQIYIKPKSGFYDYESKYTKGKTEYLFETGISKEKEQEINDFALKAYQALSCEGAARVDFIFDGENAWALEINTLPGMTETSLLPKSVERAGMNFLRLIEELLKGASINK